MSTDRELLELAAKAVGLDATWRPNVAEGGEWLAVVDGNNWTEWNPLTDDGDALRLAVKLRLDIEHGNEALSVFGCKVAYGDDPFAATRRAIVLCAAQIGRSLP